jgi:hypothetical protein
MNKREGQVNIAHFLKMLFTPMLGSAKSNRI